MPINWKKQPYRAAYQFTGGDKRAAIETIILAREYNNIGLILTQDEKYNYV